MQNDNYSIHIVDDDPGIRESLKRALKHAGYNIKTYTSGKDFLNNYDNTSGCLILDLAMPEISGHQVLEEVISRRMCLTTLILTGHATISTAISLIKAGAEDLIEKPFENKEILEKIKTLIDQAKPFFAKNLLIKDYELRTASLTPSERKVLELLLTGITSKEIAIHLGNSKRTIDIHRSRIMQKMGASTIKDLLEDWIHLEPQLRKTPPDKAKIRSNNISKKTDIQI